MGLGKKEGVLCSRLAYLGSAYKEIVYYHSGISGYGVRQDSLTRYHIAAPASFAARVRPRLSL